MCGEHVTETDINDLVRGAQLSMSSPKSVYGIIPACAGSTSSLATAARSRRDHPRMCGEHDTYEAPCMWTSGSSPHVRGARIERRSDLLRVGIIPACAGSTRERCNKSLHGWDHPRMCGEHTARQPFTRSLSGSSPHVRGALDDYLSRFDGRGIIPACAGSTSRNRGRQRRAGDHPRMCGEHLAEVGRVAFAHGIIPACAGSTSQESSFFNSFMGSSPHVRGAPGGNYHGQNV